MHLWQLFCRRRYWLLLMVLCKWLSIMSIIKSKAYCLIYSRLICRKDFKKQAHSIVFESLQTKKKILKKELSISLFSIQFLTWSRGRHSMFIHFFVCKLQNHCCAKKMGRGGGGGSPPPGPPDATCLLQIPWSIRSSFKTKLMQDYFLQNLWLIYFDRTYGYIVRKSFCVCFEVNSDELKVSSMQ